MCRFTAESEGRNNFCIFTLRRRALLALAVRGNRGARHRIALTVRPGASKTNHINLYLGRMLMVTWKNYVSSRRMTQIRQ